MNNTTNVTDSEGTSQLTQPNKEQAGDPAEAAYLEILKKQPHEGCGKFQFMMGLIVLFGMCSFGYVEYGLGYLELMPQFQCTIDGVYFEYCTNDQICDGQSTPQIDYSVNWNNATSLYNWVEQLDLICVSSNKIGLLGSSFFMGWSSSVLFIPFASDKIGRRWLFAATMMCTAGSMIGLYLSTNINLSIFFMFLAGMSTSGRTTVGYVLATEYFTPKYQVFFGTLFNFADGTTSLFLTTYYAFISKHYLYCSIIGCGYAIICCIGMIFFAKESPLWLLKMGRVSESQQILRQVMRWNGIDAELEIDKLSQFQPDENGKINNSVPIDSSAMMQEIENNTELGLLSSVAPSNNLRPSEVTQAEAQSTMFYLRQPVIRVNLLVMAYMWSACSFTYYMISFQLKYLPGNIYTNSYASGGSELIAVAIAGYIYSKIGIKLSFSAAFLLSALGGLCILFIGEESTFWMPFFVILAKFGISGGFVIVYVSTVDVFPTLFCATALGFCNFFARVLTILAPEVAEQPAPLPMILFVSLTSLGILLIQFVKPLKDQ